MVPNWNMQDKVQTFCGRGVYVNWTLSMASSAAAPPLSTQPGLPTVLASTESPNCFHRFFNVKSNLCVLGMAREAMTMGREVIFCF